MINPVPSPDRAGLPLQTDSLNVETIAVPDGPGDLTRRPISAAHRKLLEERGLIPPSPPPPEPKPDREAP